MIPFSFWKGSAAVYDPAVLSLNGWWRANSTTGYTSGTFNGVASAGSSGSRNLTEATNPPGTGSTLNGHTVADFDGTNDRLGTALTLDDFANSNAISGWLLFNADSAPADPGAGTRYAAAQMLTDVTDAYCHVGITANGVHFSYDAGATYCQIATSTGVWNFAQFKYDGTNIKLRVNTSSWASTPSSGPASLVRAMRMGANYNATAFFDGKIAECALCDSVVSDANFDNIRLYLLSRYGAIGI